MFKYSSKKETQLVWCEIIQEIRSSVDLLGERFRESVKGGFRSKLEGLVFTWKELVGRERV